MTKRDEDFLKKLLATFKIEAEEHIQNMTAGLLTLEKNSGEEYPEDILEEIFREAHSLKGAARAVNLTEIESLCQNIESVFSLMKKTQLVLTQDNFSLLYISFDIIREYLETPVDANLSGINDRIKNCKIELFDIIFSAKDKILKSNLLHVSKKNNQVELNSPGIEIKNNSVKENINNNGALKFPNLDQHPANDNLVELNSPGVEIQNDPVKKNINSNGALKFPNLDQHPANETIRISGNKLDNMLLLVEEMMNVKLTTSEHYGELKEIYSGLNVWQTEWKKIEPELRSFRNKNFINKISCTGKDKNALLKLINFSEWNYSHISNIENNLFEMLNNFKQDNYILGGMVDNLLDEVKDIIMLPMSSVFGMYPKTVRDLAADLGKSVDIEIEGAEIEVDRRILDEMKNAFLHLIRNCIDHGIETAENRIKAGKNPKGKIRILVTRKDGNKVEINFQDDGNGINLERVLKEAVNKKFISLEESKNLSDEEIIKLIFISELSTSPAITDISGRGLGLAIVREKIERLNGNISVESVSGKGTKFKIQLPLSIATFRGVLIKTSGQKFIVPIELIEKVKRITPDDIKTVENKETIIYGSKPVSLVYLSEILGINSDVKSTGSLFLNIMIINHFEKRIAYVIDEILNEQEVLVKPFNKQLARVKNISGATILGSGKVVPILNVPDLIKSAELQSNNYVKKLNTKSSNELISKSVLVVDDSITSRMLIKDVLESAGFKVEASIDGMEALTILKTESFDIVVSDVEMPRMNGFELTKSIRSNEKLSEMPVILVTALASREDREKGIDSGANAYIVKSDFNQNNLLDIIKRLV